MVLNSLGMLNISIYGKVACSWAAKVHSEGERMSGTVPLSRTMISGLLLSSLSSLRQQANERRKASVSGDSDCIVFIAGKA